MSQQSQIEWISQRLASRREFLRVVGGVAGVGAAVALVGCTPAKPETTESADDTQPDFVVIAIDNSFEPAELDIKPGQAVRWDFLGSMKHDVVAEDGSFVSELQTSGSFTHVFAEAGEFLYDCSIHPEMTGVVRVSD